MITKTNWTKFRWSDGNSNLGEECFLSDGEHTIRCMAPLGATYDEKEKEIEIRALDLTHYNHAQENKLFLIGHI